MVVDKILANAVGGKTARACDSCIRKRARWYCAADDAFLCQSCDSSVHSANPLACRHKRVRLKTASSFLENSTPAWQKGFTKKARTPRNGKRTTTNQNLKAKEGILSSLVPLVPELGNGEGENSNEENYDEQLVYRVPALDPGSENDDHGHGNNISRALFVPSEMELAEFAADVENLLGFEEESFDMEALGLVEQSKESDCLEGERVKVEEGEGVVNNMGNHDFDMEMEPFEFNFENDSSKVCEEEEEADIKVEDGEGGEFGDVKTKKKKLLRLDYEGVMMAWDSQRSPWTGGDRPELDLSDCWPHCMGSCGSVDHDPLGGIVGGGIGGGYSALMVDGGREARVSRYREKRRTRLFSKKIRYEVRKLNAEKRPRMKGRFVKRVSFAGPAAFPLHAS